MEHYTQAFPIEVVCSPEAMSSFIDTVTLHAFRRSLATLAHASGGTLKDIQEEIRANSSPNESGDVR
jgi:hypothetical protein